MKNSNYKQKDIEDLQKIKQVLVEVSKNVYRDLEFFYQADNKEQRRRIYNKEIEYNPENSYAVVCNTLCKIVMEICAKKHTLKLELIKCDTDEFGHVDLLFTAPSGRKYIINCLSDLERIQFGMRAVRFCSETYFDERYRNLLNKDEFDFLSDEENRDIDINIGFLKDMYLDEFLSMLKNEFDNLKEMLQEDDTLRKTLLGEHSNSEQVSNLTLEQLTDIKFRFLLDFCNKRRGIIGHIELVRMYKLISKRLFSKDELKKFEVADCFFDRKEKNLDDEIWNPDTERVRFLRVKLNGNIYIITTVDKRYLKMTQQEYEKFLQLNNVYEKSIVDGHNRISEAIRNKGIGVHILKHMVVRNKLQRLDKLMQNSDEEEIERIITQIQRCTSRCIKFEINGEKIIINLSEDEINIILDGESSSYRFEGDELVKKSQKGTFIYHWKDEGKYDVKRREL